jgi:hypothetical protein
MRFVFAVAALGASLAFAQQAGAGTTIEATGQYAVAPIPDREAAKARALEQAVREAMRSAVERAAGVYVQSETQTRNSALVMDRITTNASGYIRAYEVVSKTVDDKVAKVSIKAQVSTDSIANDVKAARAIVSRLFQSKLLIVIQEQTIDNKGIVTRSEFLPAALTAKFRESGFTIIDEKGTGSAELGVALSGGVAQGKLDAKEILKRSDADFILYGSANVKYLPPDPDAARSGGFPEVNQATGKQLVYFVAGDYDLSLFATRTGTQLSKVAGRLTYDKRNDVKPFEFDYSQTSSYVVETSARTIVPKFFGAVFEELRDQDVNGAMLSVRVSGLPAFDEVEDVEKALGVVEGVKAVKAGEYVEGKAEFGVQFLGNSAEFRNALKGESLMLL